eukprot:scaffold120207_cov19-Tisochrysis_lutea.AAC.2
MRRVGLNVGHVSAASPVLPKPPNYDPVSRPSLATNQRTSQAAEVAHSLKPHEARLRPVSRLPSLVKGPKKEDNRH